MITNRTHENGQAIVLLVISLVVLLGFTALAIDGGMVYSDRRYAQNAADTASLAGAGMAGSIIQDRRISAAAWSCSNILNYVVNDASDTAVLRAESNGYTITRIIGGNYADPDAEGSFADPNNRVVVECIDNGTDKYLNVRTQIEAETQTSFAHLIYNGPLTNRVEATARVKPQSPVAFGNAVVALNPLDCQGNQNGLEFWGTSVLAITGGGAYTMGCLEVQGWGGNPNVPPEELTSYIEADGVIYVGEWDGRYAAKFINGLPVPGTAPEDPEEFEIPPPDCSNLPEGDPSENPLNPGVYDATLRINNAGSSKDLNPGLYCFTRSGDAIVQTGGTFTGDGVTLYAPNGNVSITGGTASLIAPCTIGNNGVGGDPQIDLCYAPGSTYPDPAIDGVVIYAGGDVTFLGNADSNLTGLIYAPTGTVSIGGTSETSPLAINTQIIGYNVKVGGTGRLVINYDDENTYLRPTRLDMLR